MLYVKSYCIRLSLNWKGEYLRKKGRQPCKNTRKEENDILYCVQPVRVRRFITS